MSSVHVSLKHNVTRELYGVFTDMNVEGAKGVVEAFLSTQIGQGVDNNEANDLDICTVKLRCDLAYDIFFCTDDCGNRGLRDGVLVFFLKTLEKSSEKIRWYTKKESWDRWAHKDWVSMEDWEKPKED